MKDQLNVNTNKVDLYVKYDIKRNTYAKAKCIHSLMHTTWILPVLD